MAARHREIEHALDDGFVVAWDSADVDDTLRDKLIDAARAQINAALGEPRSDQEAMSELLGRRGKAAA